MIIEEKEDYISPEWKKNPLHCENISVNVTGFVLFD